MHLLISIFIFYFFLLVFVSFSNPGCTYFRRLSFIILFTVFLRELIIVKNFELYYENVVVFIDFFIELGLYR